HGHGRPEFEEFDEAVAGAQLRLPGCGIFQAHDRVGQLGALLPLHARDDLEAEQAAIEIDQAVEIRRRDGDVVDSEDHALAPCAPTAAALRPATRPKMTALPMEAPPPA